MNTIEYTLADRHPIRAHDLQDMIVREFLSALEGGRDEDDIGENDPEVDSHELIRALLQALQCLDNSEVLKFEDAEQLFHTTSCKFYSAGIYRPEAMENKEWLEEHGWWPDELPKCRYPKNLVIRLARLSAMHDLIVLKDLQKYEKEMASQ